MSASLAAWRDHGKHCSQCHANAGHPAFYCAAGWDLAQAVTRARTIARARAQLRQRQQGGLW